MGTRGHRGKYAVEKLIPLFRMAAAFRNRMIHAGATDNGGAIHSASRVLAFICGRHVYPQASHPNDQKHGPGAEFSEAAWKAYSSHQPVRIEHVAPIQALTIAAIERVENGATDRQLLNFVKRTYRLVHLTPEEARTLDKKNRTRLDPKRMAGIKIATREVWQRREEQAARRQYESKTRKKH
jgi:hypothetical protein